MIRIGNQAMAVTAVITVIAWGACGGSNPRTSSAHPSASPTMETSSARPVAEAQGTISDKLIPRDVFFGNPDRTAVQISPDGKHVSWLAALDGVLNVWVAPIAELSAARAITQSKERPIAGYFWSYDNQHILFMKDNGGDENFHIYRAPIQTQTGETADLTPLPKVRALIYAQSHRKPNEILIGLNDRDPRFHDIYRLDVRTGKRTLMLENPGFSGFIFDLNYNIKLAMRPTANGGFELLKYAPRAHPKGADGKTDPFADWKLFTAIGMADSLTTSAITTDKSGKYLYMWDSRDRNTKALFKVNLSTGKRRLIAGDDQLEASGLIIHPAQLKVMAVAFTRARRTWKVLDRSLKRDFEKLSKVNDGELNIVASTLNNKKWVVLFDRDDGPGRYYIWDRARQKAHFLFSNQKALEGLKLAKMHPRIIKARDGLELVNYLSLPPDSDPDHDGVPESSLPTVLLVHGGPWARDWWGFNTLHQFLASRGYAVLSVNFRGSTGLGKAHLNAGNKEWAGKMHDDLIDSVNWAVDNNIAAKDKICIMGGSYGGYATLVGMTLTPNVFACGIDIVGPSNIITLLEAIPPYWEPFKAQFRTRVGDWETPEGKAALVKASPLTHVDQIIHPLLIGQGANDPRVKQAESDQIVAAMKANGIPVSYILFPDEGHGFRRTPNLQVFFAAVEAFLSAHLGGTYQPSKKEQFTGTTIQVPEGAQGIPGFPALLKSIQ